MNARARTRVKRPYRTKVFSAEFAPIFSPLSRIVAMVMSRGFKDEALFFSKMRNSREEDTVSVPGYLVYFFSRGVHVQKVKCIINAVSRSMLFWYSGAHSRFLSKGVHCLCFYHARAFSCRL